MRIFGRFLIAVGLIALIRTVWLAALYYGTMSEESRARVYILTVASTCIIAAGAWFVYRHRRR